MKITQEENGFTTITAETDNEAVQHALRNLEDSLSYLSYALRGNGGGMKDPVKDLDVAVGFLAKALENLNGQTP